VVLLTLFANIRLGFNCLKVTNTLAYHNAEIITAAKRFIVLASDQKLTLEIDSNPLCDVFGKAQRR
jgi:hypothetical protein